MTPAEEEVAFYYAIGKALSQWASVERQLQRLVSSCVSPIDQVTMATGFLAIENFRSKLSFADIVIKRKFGKTPHMDRWKGLHIRVVNGAKLRNRLAHSKVGIYPEGEVGRRYGLVEWLRSKEGRRPTRPVAPTSALCLLNIAQARTEFHGLTTALANYYETLAGRPAPFPTADEQPEGPKTIRPIRDEIRAALGIPAKPSRK